MKMDKNGNMHFEKWRVCLCLYAAMKAMTLQMGFSNYSVQKVTEITMSCQSHTHTRIRNWMNPRRYMRWTSIYVPYVPSNRIIILFGTLLTLEEGQRERGERETAEEYTRSHWHTFGKRIWHTIASFHVCKHLSIRIGHMICLYACLYMLIAHMHIRLNDNNRCYRASAKME